ncbi:MAG: rod shape-determining protein [Clostridia bacterium]|nr:rod shape-determining protein [Loktanella sp.]MBQ1950632.1 rod shape-determining protein [Clostridia bacterium]
MNLGIDLGTSRIVIYEPRAGVLVDEPAVVAVDRASGRLVACGAEAEEMLGRTPASIIAARPVQKGVIADYELAEKLLRYYLHRVCMNKITKPCVAVSVAEQVTEVEQRAFIEAVVSAGARRVTLVPETVAAAIGADMDVSLPRGQMIVNIGGGTVDASVLSLKGEAVCASVRGAGMAMDEAIMRYMRTTHGLLISELMAERLKIGLASAVPCEDERTMYAAGRDTLTGLPRKQLVTAQEISESLSDTLLSITDMVRQVLEITPPELSGDIMENGVCLTGGAARMPGLPDLMRRITGISAYVAENPAQCVAIGAGRALQYASSFSAVYDLGNFSYRLSDTVTN